jgi:hypothetical protein
MAARALHQRAQAVREQCTVRQAGERAVKGIAHEPIVATFRPLG